MEDLSFGPTIVVLNPDEDCTPETFRTMLDELLASDAPTLETISGVDTLRTIRARAEQE